MLQATFALQNHLHWSDFQLSAEEHERLTEIDRDEGGLAGRRRGRVDRGRHRLHRYHHRRRLVS